MCNNNIYRVYKEEVSQYVRKDGLRMVRHWGCNGHQHVLTHYHLSCDRHGRHCNGGASGVKPDKVLGPCDHKECNDLGFFTYPTPNGKGGNNESV